MKLSSKKIVKTIIMVCFPMLISCGTKKVDMEYLKSSIWQWDNGFKIGDGDFVDFDTTDFYTISNDTIFRKGLPRCIVIETDKDKYSITIKSLNGELGIYVDSEEFTK